MKMKNRSTDNAVKRMQALMRHNEAVLFLILILLVLVIGRVNPRFIQAENLFDILRSASFIGILSIGFLFVLISGGIDISFTATATVAQYIMAIILLRYMNMPIIFVILIPLLVGIVLGSVNALLIHLLKAPSIIITIATLNAYYGSIQFISGGRWIYDFPQWFSVFPRILILQFETVDSIRYGLSIFTLIWIAIAICAHMILRYSTLGRKLFAVGGNIEAAKRAGINIGLIRLFAYSFLGGIAGLGALMHALITQTVAPNAILGQEFDVVTATILGGASIIGGKGSIPGTVLGCLLVAVVKNGLTLMKVPSFWHQVFIGGILLISVIATATQNRLTARAIGGIDIA